MRDLRSIGRLRRLPGMFMLSVAVTALVAAGCSNNDNESTGGGSSAAIGPTTVDVAKQADIAALLPAPIRDSGQLIVGVNVPYTPNEFKDSNGQIIGFDIDLMNAIGKVLGLTPVYKEADFDKIIPAVQAGTFNIGMSSFTDTKERQQQVDFVTYFQAGTQWAQQAGRSVDPNNACGKKVAVQATTIQDTDEIPAKSKACTDAGKPAIEKVKFTDQSEATNALVLGRVDAMSADSPVTAYAIKQAGGKIEPAGAVFDSAPYGYPIAKGSPLVPAIQKAVQYLIDNGHSKAIADHWGVGAGVIPTAVVNGATS
ncbi:ABC transporter substrate-binding protein [Gordonia sp. DT30]|uniref:ABC transporter substrate-binding protein n=1 Tax=unclassified Gordonia (in: high G+C Gram-positive bacteria) TaxID=2657482 RepID=UPI003CF553D1